MTTQTLTYEQILTPPCPTEGWHLCHVVKHKSRGGWVSLAGVPVEKLAWAVDSLKQKGAKNIVFLQGCRFATIRFQSNAVCNYLASKFPPACRLPA